MLFSFSIEYRQYGVIGRKYSRRPSPGEGRAGTFTSVFFAARIMVVVHAGKKALLGIDGLAQDCRVMSWQYEGSEVF